MVSIHIWQKIFSLSLFSFPEGGMSQLVLYIIPMFIVEWLGRHNSFALERMPKSFWARHLAYMVMFALIITAQYETVPYIYFQF